ncbi:MAG: hypothetical protein E6R03_05610 [Hyphomicrobiaceae bacterium]|nr:MAG: hypothetical protein E6R03_05610 [Hyphomicrobiaceae bacterium]
MKTYYPHTYNPIHEVKNWCTIRKMMRTLKNGGELPTVYTANGGLLTGTHRVSAAQILSQITGENWESYLTIEDLTHKLDSVDDDIWSNDLDDVVSILLAA